MGQNMKAEPSEILLHYKSRFGHYMRIKADFEYVLDLVKRDEGCQKNLVRKRVMEKLESEAATSKDMAYKYACAYYIEACESGETKVRLGYCDVLDKVEVFNDENE